jgi:3-methyladenine DNA glycosylase/8-oxoguanine DNA glycosylase
MGPAVRSCRVRTRTPVDLGLTFGPLVRGPYDPTSRFARGAWWRAWNTPSGVATSCVTVDPSDGAVVVDAWGPGADWTLAHAREWVGDDDDGSFAPRHPLVAELARRRPGLRLTRVRAVYDIAVATVIEQRITSIEAQQQWARLVRRYGERAPGPAPLRVAPPPERVAALADHARHRLGLEFRRGSTVSCIGREARRLDRAGTSPGDALERRLRTLRGVGAWTTATVVHFVQGDADAVPVGDWHLPSMVAFALAGEHEADDARMLELLEPFRPRRARVWRLIMAGAPRPPRRAPRARIEHLLARA